MGCNAVRTTHNAPTPEWVEACDRMGVMMMCETRQMSSNPEAIAQLSRRGICNLPLPSPPIVACLGTDGVHCVFYDLSGCRRLGIYVGNLSHYGPRKRAESWIWHPVDYERGA